jgi:hypothetical protein
MGIRRIKTEQGQPIDDLREGDDGVKAVDRLYRYGRAYPAGKPSQKDYLSPDRSDSKPPQPGFDEYRATFRAARNSDVSPAPDESANQFVAGKVADHVDVGKQWTRGYGESPHPHFDRRVSGVSNHKYRR